MPEKIKCYAHGTVCPFECMPCDECPASNPSYTEIGTKENHNQERRLQMNKKVKIITSCSETSTASQVNRFLETHNVSDIQFQTNQYGHEQTSYSVLLVYEESTEYAARQIMGRES